MQLVTTIEKIDFGKELPVVNPKAQVELGAVNTLGKLESRPTLVNVNMPKNEGNNSQKEEFQK